MITNKNGQFVAMDRKENVSLANIAITDIDGLHKIRLLST